MVGQHAACAWPAVPRTRDQGWLLRHTPGVGKGRNNSALPIEAAERYYHYRVRDTWPEPVA